MDGNILAFAQVMTVIVCSVGALILIGLGTRYLWRIGSQAPRALPTADPERLQHLESAVDAIAIEVERISEAQRFTVALLSDRLPARTDERLGAKATKGTLTSHDTPH